MLVSSILELLNRLRQNPKRQELRIAGFLSKESSGRYTQQLFDGCDGCSSPTRTTGIARPSGRGRRFSLRFHRRAAFGPATGGPLGLKD